MCGIAGFVDLESADRAGALRRMVEVLRHRGPDGTGEFLDPRCGLGMTRLAILDIEGGAQPKTAAGGDLQVVFNGEIYNFAHLRRDLIERGHRFDSRSDSEVVARAVAEWGEDAFARLHGMFAIAAWNRRTSTLLLARDRVGKKPLYVWLRGRSCVFASEPKALRSTGPLPTPSDESVETFLHLGYVPSPHSMWPDIAKLEPGHVATFARGVYRSRPYWEPPIGTTAPADAASELGELLRAAVADRLVADVEVGVLLSGGIDSTLVAQAAAAEGRVRTFTVAFDDPRADESRVAATVAQALSTHHHELRATAADALDMVDAMVETFDEPLADPSILPTMLVAQLARQHVKVVLGGDGGDELFDGYARYRDFRRMLALQRAVPKALTRAAPRLLRGPVPALRRVGLMLDRYEATPAMTYRNLAGRMTPSALESILGRTPNLEPASVPFRDAYVAGTRTGPMRADIATYLPDDVLAKVDRATMRCGLEARAPFLDTRIVEWALCLSPTALGPAGHKRIPRELLRRTFPDLAGRPKHGFDVPLRAWLLGPLAPVVDDCLGAGALRSHGFLHPPGVADLRAQLARGVPGAAPAVWTLVTFQLWHRRWCGV